MTARMRPKFGLSVSLTPEQVMERFRDGKEAGALPYEVNLLQYQVEISPEVAQRHFWSPYLKVLIEADEDRAVLDGRFGPNINVWTMFVAAYTVLFLTGTMGLIIATSQLQIGQPPAGFWISAICSLLAGLVWIAGQVGQRWAHEQMVAIHVMMLELFNDVLEDKIHCQACNDHDPRET